MKKIKLLLLIIIIFINIGCWDSIRVNYKFKQYKTFDKNLLGHWKIIELYGKRINENNNLTVNYLDSCLSIYQLNNKKYYFSLSSNVISKKTKKKDIQIFKGEFKSYKINNKKILFLNIKSVETSDNYDTKTFSNIDKSIICYYQIIKNEYFIFDYMGDREFRKAIYNNEIKGTSRMKGPVMLDDTEETNVVKFISKTNITKLKSNDNMGLIKFKRIK